MDLLSWILVGIVVVFTSLLVAKMAKPLLHYRRAKDRVISIDGEIHSFFGLEKTNHFGQEVSSFYPVYVCTVNGKPRMLNGVVRHIGNPVAFVGMKSMMLYDEETEEIWCEDDLPLMSKQIKTRLLTLVILLAVVISVNVLL